MTGPHFTKPTLRNVWYNIPLTVSFIALMLLSKEVSAPMGIYILVGLIAFVASAFVRGAYDVLHSQTTFLTLSFSLLISSILLYLFIFYTDMPPQFSYNGGYVIVKWILCGVLWLLAAFILTFLFNWMLTRDDDSQSGLFERVLNSKGLKMVVVCCVVASVVLFTVLIFDPLFWSDECFTLHLVSLSFADGIDITAHDVHPPLYYIMLKVWLSALSFGSNDTYVITVLSRLFSLVAYMLTALLCMKKLHRGGENFYPRWLLLLCLGTFSALLRYGVEIRMYSWALFFVTATYLFARDVMNGRNCWKTWIIITFFSVCAAYTHYFALISVSIIWLILLVWFCIYDRRMLLRWCVCAVIFAMAFLPWMIILLQQIQQVSTDFWMDFSVSGLLLICIYLLLPIHIILPFLFVKALRTRDNKKISFDDMMGMIVPIATLVIGLVVSLIFRPIFVERYLVPSALCMWLSLFLIFRHARSKEKFLLICMLLLAFLLSGGKTIHKFISDCSNMQAARQLLDGIGTDATFSFAAGTFHTHSMVLSCLTKSNIVTLKTKRLPALGKQRDKLLVPNMTDFENEEEMWKYLQSCKELYYVSTYKEEKTKSLIPSYYKSVYIGDIIGDYNMKSTCHIYKLIPRDEQEELGHSRLTR